VIWGASLADSTTTTMLER